MKVVGLISGTSFDAIEVAIGDFRMDASELVLRPLGSSSIPYDGKLRERIAAVSPPRSCSVEEICQLDTRIGQAFAGVAARAIEEIAQGVAELIVSHGQTIFHWVSGDRALGTLQLGQPAWIAERTGFPVLADLRSRDVAAGGHGAPLVSLFDVLLLGKGDSPRATLNLGGIANLTIVFPDRDPIAFDVGPANALIDAMVAHSSGGEQTCDLDGARAAQGGVDAGLLELLLADPYYALAPPKSTGKEHFNLAYLLEHLSQRPDLSSDDIVATLTALTAETVARDCRRYGAVEVVASGGGVRNPTLMSMLARALGGSKVCAIEEWGIPIEAKEAYAFALLGFLTYHGLPGALPSCTGDRKSVV